MKCQECDGKGHEVVDEHELECHLCRGTGKVMTLNGMDEKYS